ncbi:MAG: AIR synthase related protein [Ginsengibacter sp.]
MSLYLKRGVSAQKEEVHEAVKNLDQGLFPKAFCKIYPDYLGGDSDYINVMHADGAGTKSILAYLYWKETGDVSVWKGIAQDAVVMNLDDLLCVGIYDQIIFNSTIDRNKNLIPGEVLEQVINGTQDFFNTMKSFGINIHFLGGETADVGDVVRTIAVNGTMAVRWPKSKIISNENIKAGNVIVGLASFGKATYESEYNSGIGSNGLTSARHDILNKVYAENFKESYDNSLDEDLVYIGKHAISDIKEILSPTRTFAPLMKVLLQNNFDKIHGLIHCSGGGQTKCLKYIPDNVKVIKDNLFAPPEIFQKIREASKADDREMYQVFNMGCRMEIYTDADFAEKIIEEACAFEIDAQIIGRVEVAEKASLLIKTENGDLEF